MERQIDEKAILNLLEDLMKDEPFTRNEAIKAIIKNKINDSRIVDALLHLTVHDSSTSVRNFGRSALDVFGIEHSPIEENAPVEYPTPAPAGIRSKEPVVANLPERVNDLASFWRRYHQQTWGFVGWYVINSFLWIGMGGLIGVYLLFNIILLPANLMALIVLATIKSTRKIALGVLIALAINFVFALIFGALVQGICFIPFYFDMYYGT